MSVKFLPLLSAILVFSLGFFVFLKNRKSKINLFFLLFSASIFIWLISTFMMFISVTDEGAFFWDKFVYVGVVFVPSLVYHFGIIFVKKEKRKVKIVIIGYILSIVFLILNTTTTFFINGIYKYSWGIHSKAQFFHHIFLIFFAVYLFLLFKELFKFYKSARGLAKEQTKYVFISLLALTFGLIAFLPAYGINIYPFAYISGVVFTVILAYSIIRHRLMDIKFVLRKYSIYISSLATIIILSFLVKYIFYRFFIDYVNLADFVILIIAVSVFPAVKNYFYRVANKYFFTSLYDGKKVIADLSEKLRPTLDVEKVYKFISNALTKSFHAKAVGVLTYNEKKGVYVVRYNKGFKVGKRKNFSGDRDLQQYFIKQNKAIVVEEIKQYAYKKYKTTIDMFINYGVDVLIPLNVKDKTVGLIVLGAKESRDMYNNEDLSVLEIIGAQAAIAIENALFYEEARRFNIILKKEIKKAIIKLRTANKKLKKLDKARSEFISIASHQLRTPLTVIKGYISMMIEGSFGQLSKEEIPLLERVYKSNERLIQLVENLLNISHIESGRMQFNFQVMQLESVVKSVCEELADSAKKKGLRFEYKKPDKPLAAVKIDKEKIRQVIMNLIDNAIKYTKQGSITVKLEQSKKNIHFCVADTGIGINKEDQQNLFKKFSRGKDTSLIHSKGTGLGLYISKIMIKAHHGNIWAESEGLEKGTKFCFVIPINASSK